LVGRATVESDSLSEASSRPLSKTGITNGGNQLSGQFGLVGGSGIGIDLLNFVGFVNVTEEVGGLDLVGVSAGGSEVVRGSDYNL